MKWGGDFLDPDALARVFRIYQISAVMHLAAHSLVGESMQQPGLYFRNNVAGTLNLPDAMCVAGVDRLLFSSSVAVYGTPEYIPVDEPTPPVQSALTAGAS